MYIFRWLVLWSVVGIAIASPAWFDRDQPGLVRQIADVRAALAQEVVPTSSPAVAPTPTPAAAGLASPTSDVQPEPTLTFTSTAMATATTLATETPTSDLPVESETGTATATPTAVESVTPTPTIAATPTAISEVVIDSTGGALSSPDGHATLTFPPGATDEPLRITVRPADPLDAEPLPESELLTLWQFDAVAVNRGDAAIHTFSADVTIDLRYDRDELFGLSESVIRYWYFDEALDAWIEVPTTPVAPYHWQVKVNHFSAAAASSDGAIVVPPILESAQVDLNAGAAVFSYPLLPSPGVAGLEPSLNLNYSSARVDDTDQKVVAPWTGIGWDLAMPSITRSGERFFLNLGGVGSEIVKTGVATEWVTRNQQFMRITHSSACDDGGWSQSSSVAFVADTYQCAWTVKDQSGRTYAFGGDAQSRRYYGSLQNFAFSGFRHYQWDLSSVTDVHGNAAIYKYNQVRGRSQMSWPDIFPESWMSWVISSYPTEVLYPGGKVIFTLEDGLIDYSSTSSSYLADDGTTLQVRADVAPCISGNFQFVFETRALAKVEMQSWDAAGLFHSRAYEFDVDSSSSPRCEDATRLDSVKLAGRDGGFMPASSFAYTDYTTCSGVSTRTRARLSTILNGFGGSVVFAPYIKKTSTSCARDRFVPQRRTVKAGTYWSPYSPDVVTDYDFQGGPTWGPDGYRGFSNVTETDAVGNRNVHTFVVWGELAGRELRVERYGTESPTNLLWQRVENAYESTAANFIDVFGTPTANAFHNKLTSTTTTTKDGNRSRVAYAYDPTHGGITSVTEDASVDFPYTDSCRKRTTSYYPTPSDVLLIVPQAKQVLTTCAASPGIAAETRFFYDGTSGGPRTASNGGRGNLTATRSLVDPSLAESNVEKYVWTLQSYSTTGLLKELSVPAYDNSTLPLPAGAGGAVWSNKGRTVYTYDAGSVSGGNAGHGRFVSSETTYAYDPSGLPAYIPAFTTNLTYDRRLGTATSVTEPNGLTSTTEYDEFGRTVKRYQTPDTSTFPTTEFEYDWSGAGSGGGTNSTTVKHRMIQGSSTTVDEKVCTDGLGRASQTITPLGSSLPSVYETVRYDARGLPWASGPATDYNFDCTSPLSAMTSPTTLREYDASNQIEKTTFAGSSSVTSCAPSCTKVVRDGLWTTAYDELGHKTLTTRDGFGQPYIIYEYFGTGTPQDPHSAVVATTYDYDVLGNVTKVTDGLGNSTVMTYDALSRRKTLDDPDMSGGGKAWKYKYDAAGNLVQQEDARSSSINPDDRVRTTLSYDSLNRIRTKSYSVPTGAGGLTCPAAACVPNPGAIEYFYDRYIIASQNRCFGYAANTAIGKLTRMTDGSGQTRWCYDIRGRETRSHYTVNHPECLTGHIATTKYIHHSYDSGNRVQTLMYPDGESLTYTYDDGADGSGRLKGIQSSLGVSYADNISYHASGGPSALPLGNGYTTNYSYDSRHRLSGITTGNGTTTVQDLDYEYYEDGNIARLNDVGVEDAWFKYDSLSRLTEMRKDSLSGQLLASYQYSSGADDDRRALVSKQEGANVVALTYGDANHVHAPSSANGQLIGYDANGNISVRTGNEQFLFDAANRLTRMAHVTGWPNFRLQTDYTHDGQGRVTRQRVTSPSLPNIDSKKTSIGGIYEEQNTACDAPLDSQKYYYALGRLIGWRYTSNGASTLQYLLTDHLDSTVGRIDSTSGAFTKMSYWPFGASRGHGYFGREFTGQRNESGFAIGAYNYNARFYSTTLGTFLSADPLTVDGLNRYAYVRNNPLRYNDPSGLCTGGEMVILWNCATGKAAEYKAGDVTPVPLGCNSVCAAETQHSYAMAEGMRAGAAYAELKAAMEYGAYRNAMYALAWPGSQSIADGNAIAYANKPSPAKDGGSVGDKFKDWGSKVLEVETLVENVVISAGSEIPYGQYYVSYYGMEAIHDLPAPAQAVVLPEVRLALVVNQAIGLGVTETLDYYRAARFGRDRHEDRYAPIWGNHTDGQLRELGVPLPGWEMYFPGSHADGSYDFACC